MIKQRVVVLGGGTFQMGLIAELKKIGFEVHVVTNRPKESGASMADQCHNFGFTDTDRVTSLMRDLGAVQVLTAGSELALEIQSRVQAALALRGHSPAFIRQFRNKTDYKIDLARHCSDCVPNTLLYKSKDSELLKNFDDIFPAGVAVKPAVGGGSRAAALCFSAEEVYSHLKQYRLKEAIIEEYLSGQEYGGDFLVRDGQLLFESCTLKSVNASLVPKSHLMLEQLQHNAGRNTFFKRIIQSLSLADGVYNADIIESDGQFKLIDLSPRIGGNCLPDLVKASTGVNEWRFMAEMLLDESVSPWPIQPFVPQGVFMIGASEAGQIESLTDDHPFGPSVKEVFWRTMPGDSVEAFTEGAKHLGYVMYQARTDTELLALQQKIEDFEWFSLVD
ncbi:MAG: hypothetical protein Roseis2KO_43930 [Roseivirga sp.]